MATDDEQVHGPLLAPVGVRPSIRDRREPHEKRRAVYLILASTLLERFAFYALITTISNSLESTESFQWHNRHIKTALYIFSGTSYVSTLLFAVISDWKLGRAKTIIIGFFCFLTGLILITITASGSTSLCRFDDHHHDNTTMLIEQKCAPVILTTLVFSAIGAGAIMSNLVVLGAEQIQESITTSRYLDKYVVAVNVGGMLATLIIPYVQTNLADQYDYILYSIESGVLLLAALLFIIGWRYYLHIPTNETVILNCIPVLINAIRTWYKVKKEKRALIRGDVGGIPLELVNASATDTMADQSLGIYGRPSTLLDYAKVENKGSYLVRIVEDVKSLRRALVVFTLLIPYWIVYSQINTTFPSQGKHMREGKEKYIVSWISLGETIPIILGVAILNFYVYKRFNIRHRSSTIATKFAIGMCCAYLSMCIAGVVEIFRKNKCDNVTGRSNLSIYVQVPQTIFIGFSQLFAMVASYEYAYFAAPLSGQSLFMSLHFCSAGVSSFIGTLIIVYFPRPDVELDFLCKAECQQWYWSFYTYFFMLGGIELIFMLIFIVCYKKYQIVKLDRREPQRRPSIQY